MGRHGTKLISYGVLWLWIAAAWMIGSWVVCVLGQTVLAGLMPDVVFGIAYFGGPLPVIPAVIALCGIGTVALGACVGWCSAAWGRTTSTGSDPRR